MYFSLLSCAGPVIISVLEPQAGLFKLGVAIFANISETAELPGQPGQPGLPGQPIYFGLSLWAVPPLCVTAHLTEEFYISRMGCPTKRGTAHRRWAVPAVGGLAKLAKIAMSSKLVLLFSFHLFFFALYFP